MIWGVRFLQEATGLTTERRSFDRRRFRWDGSSAARCWAFSDRIGRRKPVIMGGAVRSARLPRLDSLRPADVFPPYVLGTDRGHGVRRGDVPYTVIKEANPPQLGGTATGVIGFLNFTFSALLGPVFGWMHAYVSRRYGYRTSSTTRSTFSHFYSESPLAIVLTIFC